MKGPTIVPLVGCSNQSDIVLNGQHCQALTDTGSMITTICESFFKSMTPTPEIFSLEDFALDVSAANDSKVPYKGYALLEFSVPSLNSVSITVPVLIVSDT